MLDFMGAFVSGGEDPAALPMAMLLVFATAKLLGELCERLGQPAIAGQIAAGALLGGAGLRWVEATPARAGFTYCVPAT